MQPGEWYPTVEGGTYEPSGSVDFGFLVGLPFFLITGVVTDKVVSAIGNTSYLLDLLPQSFLPPIEEALEIIRPEWRVRAGMLGMVAWLSAVPAASTAQRQTELAAAPSAATDPRPASSEGGPNS